MEGLTIEIKLTVGSFDKEYIREIDENEPPVEVISELLKEINEEVALCKDYLDEDHKNAVKENIDIAKGIEKEELVKSMVPAAKKNILATIRKYWKKLNVTDLINMYDFVKDPRNLLPTLYLDIFIYAMEYSKRVYFVSAIKEIIAHGYGDLINKEGLLDSNQIKSYYRPYKSVIKMMEEKNLSYEYLASKFREEHPNDCYLNNMAELIGKINLYKINKGNDKQSCKIVKQPNISPAEINILLKKEKRQDNNVTKEEMVEFTQGKSSTPLVFCKESQIWAAKNGLYLEQLIHSEDEDVLCAVMDNNFGLNVFKNSTNEAVIRHLKCKVLNDPEDIFL